MLELIFAKLGQPMRAQSLPLAMMKFLGLFVPVMRELAEMNYQWTNDYDFRSDKIQARFGLTPTPHDLIIDKTLAWVRASAAA